MHSKSNKTVYIIGGISGLQAYSTHIVTTSINEELVNNGWDCKLLILNPKFKPQFKLLRWFSEALYRHIIYPIWCRYNIPKHALIYITDHANAGTLRSLKKPNKCVIHVHDLTSLRPLSEFPYPMRWRNRLIYMISKITKKKGIEAADHVIEISNFTSNEILTYLSVNKNDITIAHNGINHDVFFPENKLKSRKRHNLPKDAFIILTLGVASYRKNYSVIAKALLSLNTNNKKIIWIHIGQVDRDTRSTIDKYRNVDFINFLEVPDTELRYFYSGASIFISSSFYEGFGLPPVEALACGTNIIVSDIPAHNEVLSSSALYFDPKNYNNLRTLLEAIINDNDQTHKIEDNTSKAKSYNWRRTAMIVNNVLEKLNR